MSTGPIEHPADDVLTAYALGAKDAAVESHVAACPSCSRQIKEVRTIARALESMPDEEVPAGTFNNVLKAARHKHGGLAEWFSLSCTRLMRNTFGLVAALVAVILFLYIFIVFVL